MQTFSDKIINWQAEHGRHHLPWQLQPTPYRVWISEVMLQQTQVKTVIPYFNKFMQECPNVKALSTIEDDALMNLWQGLGYYSRARNLKKSAQIIVSEYSGSLPSDMHSLIQLPGIGRSTAAAILSLAYEQPAAILDGNVKRVLARYFAVTEDLKKSATLKQLWKQAESLLPQKNARAYTQGLMDLGAQICMKRNPLCSDCPIETNCLAHQKSLTDVIPKSRSGKKPKSVSLYVVINIYDQQIYFIKRPSKGIWAGLYTPEIYDDCSTMSHQYPHVHPLKPYQHRLTHQLLTIHPFIAHYQPISEAVSQPIDQITLPIPTGIKPALTQAIMHLNN